MEEIIRGQKNAYYYNKILEKDRDDKQSKIQKTQVKIQAFSTQKIDLKDYIYLPEGMEFIAYSVYVIVIPYIVGAIFLFFAIAGASFDNFMLLDLSKAFIVWAIGYEITASALLIWIFILFMRYDGSE